MLGYFGRYQIYSSTHKKSTAVYSLIDVLHQLVIIDTNVSAADSVLCYIYLFIHANFNVQLHATVNM